MKIVFYSAATALLIALITVPAFAQTGCFDSPEAPTDVLLVVGAAGMFQGPRILRKVVSLFRNR